MPGSKRRIYPCLIQRLQDEPYRFEFVQAVRLLLAQHRQYTTEDGKDVLGQIIRFRSSTSLAFPPSEVESLTFEWIDRGECAAPLAKPASFEAGRLFRQVTVTPAFIGLTGPSGVLPRHYTQHVADRAVHYRDTAVHDFFDIFTTRIVALYYQSWLKYRPHLQFEVQARKRFLLLALSLSGLGTGGVRERLADEGNGVSDESLAYYVSFLRQRPSSIDWFSRIISDYFRVACRVEQHVGQWIPVPESGQSKLGIENCLLGSSSFCGARAWDRQSRIRLILGPMRRARFDAFLPGGQASRSLARLLALMIGITLDCEVCLVLDRKDRCNASLARYSGGTRLGWDGWLAPGSVAGDSDDVAYLLEADRNS